MDDLEKIIEKVLMARFPGASMRFDPYPGFGKLHTTIVWDGFQNQLQIERQRQVWEVLRPVLTEEQRFATGFLLTVTPAEINAMQEVAA